MDIEETKYGSDEPNPSEAVAVAAAKSVEQKKLEEDFAKLQAEANRLKTMCYAINEFMDDTQTRIGEIQNNFNQIRKNIKSMLAPPKDKE